MLFFDLHNCRWLESMSHAKTGSATAKVSCHDLFRRPRSYNTGEGVRACAQHVTTSGRLLVFCAAQQARRALRRERRRLANWSSRFSRLARPCRSRLSVSVALSAFDENAAQNLAAMPRTNPHIMAATFFSRLATNTPSSPSTHAIIIAATPINCRRGIEGR